MSFHLNPINPDIDYVERTQRIYIDPQQLIALKAKRKSFPMVPSVFQPPQDQLYFKQQTSWNNTTNYSLINNNTNYSLIKNKTISNSDKRFSKNIYQNDQQTFPQQKIKLLQEILQGQNIAPNVQFVWKLLPSNYKKHIINFQEGDCIPFNGPNDDKYLILSGEVRIIGTNDHQYKRKPGFLFFLSNQTSAKIKQIVALRSTKLLKIPNNIYQSLINNYLYLKNSQKIKFIQFCPFLIWKYQLTEDLASCMDMKLTEKEEIIYQANSVPDCIYFVKEGIVLLERNNKLMNPVVADYEQHYEKNEISEKDTILVVRKGMAFGIDGIIIKEFTASAFSNFQIEKTIMQANQPSKIMQSYSKQQQKAENQDQQNPQTLSLSKETTRKNTRIYTAKTLGKCEIYCLDKKIIQTLFSISDINEQIYAEKKQIQPQELQRMSIEYTNMLLNNIHPSMAHVPLKKKELVLKVDNKAFPKSKSLAVLEHRHNNSQMKHQRLNHSPKAFLLKKKKLASQQNVRTDLQIKNQFYLNEQRQRNELRSRIYAERQKQKQMRVKKAINENLNAKKDSQEVYMLPKIGANPNESNLANKPHRKQSNKQKLKLQQIIGRKLKQSIKNYSKLPQHKKNTNISINNQYTSKQSELSKLLEENKDFKKNPSFFNIKSYKSIISAYQSTQFN